RALQPSSLTGVLVIAEHRLDDLVLRVKMAAVSDDPPPPVVISTGSDIPDLPAAAHGIEQGPVVELSRRTDAKGRPFEDDLLVGDHEPLAALRFPVGLAPNGGDVGVLVTRVADDLPVFAAHQ